MPSETHRARTRALILALIGLSANLSACARPPAPILLASPCSTLIPTNWREGVPAPPLPSESTAGALAAYADAAVGQLDKANGRTMDAVSIVEACERRDQASAQTLTPHPWWRLF